MAFKFKPEDLIVYHKGKPTLRINSRLLDRQECWKNLDKIKSLHSERLHLEDLMRRARDKDRLAFYDAFYSLLEFELQNAWRFPKDINFHIFWNRPRCECPKMDNEDSYPYGHYTFSTNCPLHGKETLTIPQS